MKVKMLAALSVTALMSCAVTAAESEHNIQFDGEITEASCSIDNTTNNSVNLGKFKLNYFHDNMQTTPVNFDIKLRDCPGSMEKISLELKAESKGMLITNKGTASGVGIVVYHNGNSIVPIGDDQQFDISPVSGKATVPFEALIMKSDVAGIEVLPGTVTASMTYNVIYN